jgi:hypothetical protein
MIKIFPFSVMMKKGNLFSLLIVTRFPWMANKFATSNSSIKWNSAACKHGGNDIVHKKKVCKIALVTKRNIVNFMFLLPICKRWYF